MSRILQTLRKMLKELSVQNKLFMYWIVWVINITVTALLHKFYLNFHKNTNEFTKEATFCKRALHVFHCFSLKNWRSLHLKVNCTWNFYIEVMYVNDFGEKLKDLAYLSVGHHADFVSVKPIHLGFWTWIEWNHSDQRDKEPANDKNWAFVFFLFQPYCNVIFAFVVNRTTDFLGSAGSDQLKDKNRERSKFSCLCLP